MGAGFALFVDPVDAQAAVQAAVSAGCMAWVAGEVEDGIKRVLIDPIDVTYESDQLRLRDR
jgi:phosphoribosylformylglycinamidine cyclo-ligase